MKAHLTRAQLMKAELMEAQLTKAHLTDMKAVYQRVSSGSQREDSQESSMDNVISQYNPEQIRWYVDHGVSATKKSWKERPAFQRLIKDITLGIIKTLIVFARDRLARNPYEWIRLWRILRKHRVEVIFTMPGHAPMTSNAFTEMLYAHMAYEEANKIKLRTRQAQYSYPHKLYGYITHDDSDGTKRKRTYSVDKAATEVLVDCFHAVSRCKEPSDVASVLSEYARRMHVSSDRLFSRLTDERYTGTVKNRHGDVIFPMIIQPELFNRVKVVLEDVIRVHQTERENPLFIPLCAKCSQPMQLTETLRQQQWKCSQGHRVSIWVNDLNDIVRSTMTDLTRTIDLRAIQTICLDKIKQTQGRIRKELESLDRTIGSLAEEIVTQQNTHARKTLLQKKFELKLQQKKYLLDDVEELQAVFESLEGSDKKYSTAVKQALQNGDAIPQLTAIFIDEILIHPDLVEMHFKHSDLLETVHG